MTQKTKGKALSPQTSFIACKEVGRGEPLRKTTRTHARTQQQQQQQQRQRQQQKQSSAIKNN